ncbi:hypothetical protein [Streptomyces sp. HUAS ZL42]|uniref:hypothetical protein n=1 Tax=Streptomyces sp. HUAS ZL42 TaxID=3231715 RepID=UPI00345EFE44
MASWVITVKTLDTEYPTRTVAELDGTREQAEAALYDAACTEQPEYAIRKILRRKVFRYADGSYYVCLYGRSDQPRFKLVLRLAELVLDTPWPTQERPDRQEPEDRIPGPWRR